MAMFKCKMCGGDLDVNEEIKVVECEYCGTKQTIPSMDNEKKINLFNRANRLRFANEFDKAAGVYESIAAEFPEEAEAYWGLCLCKYGIEYVDDPATGKKIPTCHRTSFDGIFNDSNFELALEYSDSVAVSVYREEAKEIDRLQKAILDIANKEEPFDIFICYKETAEDGQRTKDSVLAQDMYDKLTEKGYKVFFARITLEDKLGQEYEPYIFSALNSAKIMLAIGTKYEYYNAVWVKNEWSRFLDMMKKDKEKVLIPCYADIDAYDMPQEFKNLQGQDMGKVGFMQDLVRGIGKIISLEDEKPVAAAPVQTVVQQVVSNSKAENLLKRGFLALKDEKWDEAGTFFERVLDENVEEARAHLGKLMVLLRARDEDALCNGKCRLPGNFAHIDRFQTAYQYADETFKKRLDEIVKSSKYNCIVHSIELDDTDEIDVWSLTLEDYVEYKQYFEKMGDYQDSKAMLEKCQRKIEIIQKLKEEQRRQKEDAINRIEKEIYEKIKYYLSKVNYWVSETSLDNLVSKELEQLSELKKEAVIVGKYISKLLEEGSLEELDKTVAYRYQLTGFKNKLNSIENEFIKMANDRISEIEKEIKTLEIKVEQNKFKFFGVGAKEKDECKNRIDALNNEKIDVEDCKREHILQYHKTDHNTRINKIYIKEGQLVRKGDLTYKNNNYCNPDQYNISCTCKILAIIVKENEFVEEDNVIFISTPAKYVEWGLIKE